MYENLAYHKSISEEIIVLTVHILAHLYAYTQTEKSKTI